MKNRLKGLVWGIVACIVLTLLFGCKTKYVGVPEYHTEYKTRVDSVVKRDSVWVHDSVYVWMRGDTVFKDRWHTELKWHNVDRICQDTIMKTDSVRVPYEVERVVYKERGKGRSWIFGVMVVVGVAAIGGMILRRGA